MPCVAELNESESERLRRENEKTFAEKYSSFSCERGVLSNSRSDARLIEMLRE